MNSKKGRVISFLNNIIKAIFGERGKTWILSKTKKAIHWIFEKPNSPFSYRLQREIQPDYKIGMAVLAHERPEYLELCLETLFRTNLYNYDITFLLQDDGSLDPRVREIIDKPRNPQYKIIRIFNPKGNNSWGAAFNCAIKKLLEINDFDIVGTCDSDAIFHPEWLDQTMKICLWAKENHHEHVLGPFSSFNSSDYKFHKILGTYPSPYGNFVVKRRMGALNYFYFTKDLLKLGFYNEGKDDETKMTALFNRKGVRNFCTETSYVEHVGQQSILNQWRPVAVKAAVYGMNLVEEGWGDELVKADTLGYYRYVKKNISFGEGVDSDKKIDVLITAINKDLITLPLVIENLRKHLKHPIGSIYIISPDDQEIKRLCAETNCINVPENSVLPIDKNDINYYPKGIDRNGWLFQQFLKLSGDSISSREFFYVIDADTLLACPQVFIVNNKTLLLHSDEHHHPYFEMYKKLFGTFPSTNLSFVAHQMMFSSKRLKELKNNIEKMHHKTWYQAIIDHLDLSQLSAFSEYETYGQWMLQNHPDEIIREYWFNRAVPRDVLGRNDFQVSSILYRSYSSHSYIKK